MVTVSDPIDRAIDRLDQDGIDPDVGRLIRDALQSVRDAAETTPDPSAAPAHPYLQSVAVTGFRGIGPEATLEVPPGPGLTLVVGRNGSGKSSFADALELLLTGDTMRWSKRTADWKRGWRNLHHNGDTAIRAQFLVEGGVGPVTLQRSWTTDDDLEDGTDWAQPHGKQRIPLVDCGWRAAAAAARPFLSYSELGSMLDQGPSKLYDAMSQILGLDALVTVAENLRRDRLAREKEIKAAKAELEDRILPELRDSDDPRAIRCLAAVETASWHLEQIEAIVGGDLGNDVGAEIELLRATASFPASSLETIEHLVADAQRALTDRAGLAGTDAHRAAAVADLLNRALKFHSDHSEPDCPVCGTVEILDDAWRQHAIATAAELETRAAEARAAERRVHDCFATLRTAAAPIPLDGKGLARSGVDTTPLTATGEMLATVIRGGDDAALLDDVTVAFTDYSIELSRLQEISAAEAARRDDAWRPIAVELSGWLARGRRAREDRALVGNAKSAEKWIRKVADDVRRERFEPIAARAQEVWSQLSIQSNVELRDLVLSGTTTNRKLQIDVTVDGVEGVALGVMSQGELHGLALSLFLPRATLPESPFRFVVIDDPVQAMDPSRVDGLARVLAGVGADRQVIVFTHDDRLPEAVRRLQLPATILDVTRRTGSVVSVHKSLGPVEQALDDARALAVSDGVPLKVRERLVPGLCRTALEAAAIEAVRRRRLGAGQSHADLEHDLAEAQRLTHYFALALFDDIGRGGEVMARINKFGPWAGDAFQICNKGVHGGYRGDLKNLVGDVTSLAARVRRVK